MKKIIANTMIAASLLTGMTACSDDWLSLSDPNLETADTFWQTSEQFNEGLTAAYSTWRRPAISAVGSRYSPYFAEMKAGVTVLTLSLLVMPISICVLTTMSLTKA